MTDHFGYQINAPHVIGEVIDDEAIVVNLDSGAYYSLRGTGAFIWELLASGANDTHIVDALASAYDAPVDTIRPALSALFAELEAEQLVTRAAQPAGEEPSVAARLPAGGGPPFTPPVLEKFTDMADLLLLDPIHDVDAGGWPQPKQR